MGLKTTQFESVLEAVPDALVGIDQKGAIRFVNHQTELLFGHDREQLIGQHISMLVPEALWQVYSELGADFFADSQSRPFGVDLELSGRHHNGGQFPIYVRLSPIDTGDVLLAISGAGDVARHRQAVAKAELLDAVVRYSGDAIMGADLNGIITSWNPAAERLYGYSSQEALGADASLLMPEDRAGDEGALLAKIKDGVAVENFETTRVRKDGTVFPVSLSVAPVRGEDGTVVGVSVICRDVTEQKKAFETAQRLSALVQYSDDAITSSTLEGIITSWNPAAERLYGYSGEEVIGKPADFLTPKGRAGEMNTVMEQFGAGETVLHFENTVVRKDGTLVPVSITLSGTYDEDGQIVRVSAVHRDMTEQVQKARALAEASWQHRLLAENASDLVVMTSPDRVVTWVSPSVPRVLGWAVEDLMGKTLVDLVHPEDTAAFAGVREAIYSGQEVSTPSGGFQLRWLTKSGQYRWMPGSPRS